MIFQNSCTIGGADVGNKSYNDGGGIYNAAGTATITGSDIYSNTATGSGGGIENAGVVIITNSNILSNTATSHGGGVRIYADGNIAAATIANTTISNNIAGSECGGILLRAHSSGTATLTLDNSTVSNNKAGSYGGGFEVWLSGDGVAEAALTNSDIISNTAGSSNGGGVEIWASSTSTATVTFDRVTISGNDAGWDGGGVEIWASSTSTATVTFDNSTISGNDAGEDGGGIHNNQGRVNLSHVTIANNTADSDDDDSGEGGGIYQSSGAVNLEHSIVAGNTVVVSTTHATADCYGTVASQGYNLVGAGSGCSIAGPGDQTVAPAIVFTTVLGPMADNGGDTWTHALLAGSPAIDAVPVISCTLATDQRGVSRPQGSVCDIGAYEAAPELSIDKTVTPETDVTYHGTVTYTVVLNNSGIVSGIGVLLTDTLPSEVDFAHWVAQPAGASVAADRITWSGTVPANTAITFVFAVTHTGDYGDVVTNTAEYGHASGSGDDDATFTVQSMNFIYLPLVLRNA